MILRCTYIYLNIFISTNGRISIIKYMLVNQELYKINWTEGMTMIFVTDTNVLVKILILFNKTFCL